MSAHSEFELAMRRLGVVVGGSDEGEGRGGRALVVRVRGPTVVSFRVVGRGEAARVCDDLYRRDPLFSVGCARRLSKLSARVVRRECARLGVETRASPSKPNKTATKKVLIQRMLGGLRRGDARAENNVTDARNDGDARADGSGAATHPGGVAAAVGATAAPDEHRDAVNESQDDVRPRRRRPR